MHNADTNQNSVATNSNREQLWTSIEQRPSYISTTIRNNIVVRKRIPATITLNLMYNARVVVCRRILVVLARVASIGELITRRVEQDTAIERCGESWDDGITRLI